MKLFLNSQQESQAMIEGLSYISDLLGLYKFVEHHYLHTHDAPMGSGIRHAIEKLYSEVFEYQAQMIVHLSKSSINRGFRAIVKIAEWKDLVKKIKLSNGDCKEYFSLADKKESQQYYENQSSQVLQSI